MRRTCRSGDEIIKAVPVPYARHPTEADRGRNPGTTAGGNGLRARRMIYTCNQIIACVVCRTLIWMISDGRLAGKVIRG
jgi:hypothetical protein